MGEHADDDGHEDEESSAPSTDDSPPERDDARSPADDGEDAAPSDDESAPSEETAGSSDEPAGADEDATAADDERREKAAGVEPAEPLPSAEEWLADNPDYEGEPPDFADDDEETDGADDSDGDVVDAGENGDENADGVDDNADDADEGGDDAAEETEGDDDASQDDADAPDGDATDETPNRIEEGDSLDVTGEGSDEDATDEPHDAREARARAIADDRSPEEQNADLDLDDGDADETEAAADEAKAETEEAEADADDDVEGTTTTMSTSDPGSNAPAGMGQPTPAGGGGSTGSSGSFPGFDDEMAPDDEEQPLTEHIEEMTHRFLYVALVMGLVAAVALLGSDDMINFLWYSFLGPDNGTCPGLACPVEWRPHLYHPLSLVLARLKMAALIGFIAGLPVAVYQTYRFMRPGLYPHERRYYLAAVPTSLVLAVTGVAFAYYVVLPSLFIYFSSYSTQAAELAFALSDTFNLMVMMLGFFALIFQIPLLVMLAIMMGVTTRRWLEQRRIYFWTGFGGVAFIFSPDPTGMAPLLVAVTMIALFEGTLLLLRWTERSVALFSAETLANNRPYAWALAAFVGYVVSAAPVPEGYFGQLPPVVVETLTEYGYVGFTPAVVGGAIVLVFEAIGWIARRVAAGQGRRTALRVRLAFLRIRPFAWLVAIVVGYMASPDPVILDIFRDVSVSAPIATGVAVGLIVAYEALRLVLSYVRPE